MIENFVKSVKLISDDETRESLLTLAETLSDNDLAIGKTLNTTIERCTQLADIVNTLADKILALEAEMRELKAINKQVN